LHALWDHGSTQSHAKSSIQIVTNATVSLVTHVTRSITRELTEDDLENGFANRFLYVWSERTQYLPMSQSIAPYKVKELQLPLLGALEFSRHAPENYDFTDEAQIVWNKIGRYWWNLAGKDNIPFIEKIMSGRARPAIRRMAVIYAVADCSEVITLDHLEAASSFWRYCFESASYIFADRIGDPIADKIYRGLIEYAPGLTISEIHRNVFKSNKSMPQIKRALMILLDRGLIERDQMKGKNSRKSVDRYFIPQHQAYEGET